MSVPLRLLRLVAAVAAARSVGGAARLLHQSPSSVTRGVQGAEALLGIRLFERGVRGMTPTAATHVLVERVARAQHALQVAAAGLRQRGAAESVFALPRLVSEAQLRAFIIRAEHASESAAADVLGLSQSALHQMLGKFEHLARMPLFERTRVGARLNEAGRWMLQQARLTLAELRVGHEELARWRGGGGGCVSIGALPMAGDVLVAQGVVRAMRMDPSLDVTVKDGTYESLCQMLRSAEVDLIVGPLRGPAASSDLQEETLLVDRFVVVGRAGHPLRDGPAPTLARLAAYPWVGPLPGTPAQRVFDQLFEEAGVPQPRVDLHAHSAVLLRSVLAASDHLALLSPLHVHADVRAGRLAHLSEPIEKTERAIGITQRADALASTACRGVLEALRQAAVAATQ